MRLVFLFDKLKGVYIKAVLHHFKVNVGLFFALREIVVAEAAYGVTCRYLAAFGESYGGVKSLIYALYAVTVVNYHTAARQLVAVYLFHHTVRETGHRRPFLALYIYAVMGAVIAHGLVVDQLSV